MSKFFLTNNLHFLKKAKNCVEKSGYKISFEYGDDMVFALTTKKLVVDNENGVKCGGGFAIVTGTMAWGEGKPINAETLEEIYNDFNGNADDIRRNSLGGYAVSILKNDLLYVFGEIVGFYNIYYYHVDGEWLISNSLYDMATILKEFLSLNTMALIESTVQDGILLDDTYFNEIHRLSGFNHLMIKTGHFSVFEEVYNYPMAKGALDEKVSRYVAYQKNYGKRMANAYGDPVISMTGGLDARMVMSTYLSTGIKPHLYYGTGNSFITNTLKEDKEIDLIFAQKYNLTYHDASWATPYPMDKYWENNLQQYGFHFDTYAGSNDVIESIKSNPCQLYTFGYCGELLRSLPWIEKREKDYFTLDEYIEEFYLPDRIRKTVENFEPYYEYIKGKQLKICKYYQLDVNHISNEDIFYLSLERRKSADAYMLNHLNLIKYCCYTLGQYESLTAGRITCKEAENSGFMLRCLDALYPSVLEVPVFSHCTMRVFYRETMSLNPQNKPLSLKKRAKVLVREKVPGLVTCINKILGRKNVWRNSEDEKLYNYALFLYDKYNTYHVVKRDLLEARRLINYVMRVYALNRLKT